MNPIALLLLFLQPLAFQNGSLPDPKMTPGDVLAVTERDICVPGYTKKVRNVPATVKRQVYAEYSRKPRKPICCEVDHLIPLELGGSNRKENLWPEPYNIQWNARVKDQIENKLHRMVCAGQIELVSAQKMIAKDWIAAYRKYVGAEPGKKR